MASVASPERYRFGAFELQLDERRLLQDSRHVPLRPRAFDLLWALVDRAGHLVSKDELLERVWPRLVVEEAALRVQLSALRKVLGADAIATVSGHGYRFTLPVTKRKAEPQCPPTPRHNLPCELTSFVGREQEIAQLEVLVATHRLVTLTGAGGAGKSRLAIELGIRLAEAFADGVWLVELASLSEARLVPQAVAHVLQIKEQPTRPLIETLSDHLASRKLLLVLDNIEHLLDESAKLADFILRRSPDVAMLVTSRERLGMAGELAFRVPSLTVPGRRDQVGRDALLGYEGVRLFIERARLLRPHFAVTTVNAASVASICSRLDGIPLAIELAAPRLRSMSVEEVSRRLDDRFALLTDGSRTGLPRHRTLRSTIDWSYDLLTGAEQALLRRVSVFAGGWTLAAAEHACTDDGIEKSATLELLASLADKSLVVTEEHEEETRYRMLETIRQYALARLRESGEEGTWRNRHLAWVVALAEASREPIYRAEQLPWLDRIAAEIDNFRAAFQWAIEEKLPDALRIARGLPTWWIRRASLTEAREWFHRLLDAIPNNRAELDRARTLSVLGLMARDQADYREAERLLRQAHALASALGSAVGPAHIQSNLATVAIAQGRYAEAEGLLVECIPILRSFGDDHSVARSLGNLALAVADRGDVARAASLFEESVEMARRVGDGILTSSALSCKGKAALRHGELESAEASFREGLGIARAVKDPNVTIMGLEGLAALAVATGAPARAAILWGAIARLREQTGTPEHEEANALAEARRALGDDAFDQAWREGRSMELEQAFDYAGAPIMSRAYARPMPYPPA